MKYYQRTDPREGGRQVRITLTLKDSVPLSAYESILDVDAGSEYEGVEVVSSNEVSLLDPISLMRYTLPANKSQPLRYTDPSCHAPIRLFPCKHVIGFHSATKCCVRVRYLEKTNNYEVITCCPVCSNEVQEWRRDELMEVLLTQFPESEKVVQHKGMVFSCPSKRKAIMIGAGAVIPVNYEFAFRSPGLSLLSTTTTTTTSTTTTTMATANRNSPSSSGLTKSKAFVDLGDSSDDDGFYSNDNESSKRRRKLGKSVASGGNKKRQIEVISIDSDSDTEEEEEEEEIDLNKSPKIGTAFEPVLPNQPQASSATVANSPASMTKEQYLKTAKGWKLDPSRYKCVSISFAMSCIPKEEGGLTFEQFRANYYRGIMSCTVEALRKDAYTLDMYGISRVKKVDLIAKIMEEMYKLYKDYQSVVLGRQ